jgi:hypothetical protein
MNRKTFDDFSTILFQDIQGKWFAFLGQLRLFVSLGIDNYLKVKLLQIVP